MAASSEQQDVVPIFGLPDDLLMEIFSYITFIPAKLKLERVSKRIQYVSSRPQSWKGIHTLYMSNTGDSSSLNDISVPFFKWPAAIQQLLERTHINELTFEYICGNFNEYPDVMIMRVFSQHLPKLKLKYLECNFDANQFCWFSIQLLQTAVPYLEQFLFSALEMNDDGTNSLAQIWPIISECNSLKFFYFDCHRVSVDWTALKGKPLTEIEVVRARNVRGNNDLDNLIEVINSAKGIGIHVLFLWGLDLIPQNVPTPFKYFCDNLNEKSREKLREIKGYYVKADEINHLYLVPSIFPNLKKIVVLLWYSGINNPAAIDIDQFCTMAVSFLNLAHSQLSNCAMRFLELTVGGSAMQLQQNLQIASQNQGITVQFDNNGWSEALLSKGNASIIISCLKFE